MRILDISDGFSSASAPSVTTLSASGIQVFANDAAFVTNKGSAAAQGDIYFNSTDLSIHIYDGSVWHSEATLDQSQTFTSMTVNGPVAVPQTTQSSGGTLTAMASTTSFVKLTGSSTTAIQGIAGGANGKWLTIFNASSGSATLLNLNGGASAANQIVTPNAQTVTIKQNGSVELFYDSVQSLWIVSGGSAVGGSGGGGGGSLQWQEWSNAPTPNIEYAGVRVYQFQSALAQQLYAAIVVPTSYNSGSPIKLKMAFYSPDTSGTALLTAVSTLIRSGTDAINSTTNQRTSTNTAVTLTSTLVPQQVSFDLTDTSGKINSVSVSPGDTILVALTRGTDTATSDLRAMVYDAEVTFS